MSDKHIILTDPDDPNGPPAFDGPAAKAPLVLEPGTYEVTDHLGRPATLVVHPNGEHTVTR